MKLSDANRLRVLYFLVFCCTASWLPLFADYLKDHGQSGFNIGLILSIPPAMMLVVQPFYGMVADRIGYRKVLLWSSLLASITYAFYQYDGGFVYLVVVTIFMAIFYNTLQPVLDSLSLRLSEQDPSFSYGTLRVAGAAGWAFTGIVVGHYIDAINTSVIFLFSSASMFLTFLFSFSLTIDNSKRFNAAPPRNLKEVFNNPTLLFLLLAVVLTSAGATTIWNFYSIYMKENGASASLVGYGLSFQGLCELPVFYFSAMIIRRLGIKTTLVITILATALRLWLYSVIGNPKLAIAIEVLHGISWSLFWVVCVECVNSLVDEDWRATGQSLLYAAYFGAGAIAGNFWTGYLYDEKIRISQIFLLNACMVIVIAVIVGLYFKGKRLQVRSMSPHTETDS
jgi:MFS transporter, PPP family, 3-phenylpropionic acid transporter